MVNRDFPPTEFAQHRVLLNYDGLAENVGVPALVDELAKVVAEEAA
jgi:MoxR-like ATPase